jgi:magnesium-transporting ATPase (P-type)
VVGIVINLYQTYTLNNKIYEMAYYEIEVNVLRNDKVVKISSMNVVPGDIVFLNDPIKIPFDAIIL